MVENVWFFVVIFSFYPIINSFDSSERVACVVMNQTYQHGARFSLDCRTQCTCQNGTYGCSSLCPQEHIRPKHCAHARLIDLPAAPPSQQQQCCRQWMCDSITEEVVRPPSCSVTYTKWTQCSAQCGSGLSTRMSTPNACQPPTTVTRMCQTRRCQPDDDSRRSQHHLRKGHECKATHRLSEAAFLRLGPCRSRKRYRPKYCGSCPPLMTMCQPSLSTTVNVEFICEGGGTAYAAEPVNDLIEEYLEPGADMWADEPPPTYDSDESRLITVAVQWILKCHCAAAHQPEIVLHRVHRT